MSKVPNLGGHFPPALSHPAWCVQGTECTITGELGQGSHVGRPSFIRSSELIISVRLYQGARIEPYPASDLALVLVEIDDSLNPEMNAGWPMQLGAAKEFAEVVRSMVAVATR